MATNHNMLNSQLLISQKGGGVLFLAADYGGIAMESIPVINGTHSCDERRTFPVGGRLNDLRLKCCIDRQNEKNNITGRSRVPAQEVVG